MNQIPTNIQNLLIGLLALIFFFSAWLNTNQNWDVSRDIPIQDVRQRY